MATTAADAADRVEQLTALTRRLTDLLAEEARSFEARRPHEVAARVDETGKLANAYRHETARIKADPSLIAGAPVADRRALIAATETFEAVLARHGRAVGAAKAISEGLVHAIAQEVSNARSAVSPYRPDGRAAAGEASAITLNKTA